MKKLLSRVHPIGIVLISVAVASLQAQRGPAGPQMRGDGPPPEPKPFSITKLDPALDLIIAPEAKLVELARGFGLSEGGLWIQEGRLLIFAGLLDNVLCKVTPQGQVSAFMEKAGYTATMQTMSGPRLARVAATYSSSARPAQAWITRAV
jgi:hypothetical protein